MIFLSYLVFKLQACISFCSVSYRSGAPLFLLCLQKVKAQMPTPNPETPKKNTAFTRTFLKNSLELFLLPCNTSQKPDGNCSEKLVQTNLFILGGSFRVDFPLLIKSRCSCVFSSVRESCLSLLPVYLPSFQCEALQIANQFQNLISIRRAQIAGISLKSQLQVARFLI